MTQPFNMQYCLCMLNVYCAGLVYPLPPNRLILFRPNPKDISQRIQGVDVHSFEAGSCRHRATQKGPAFPRPLSRPPGGSKSGNAEF